MTALSSFHERMVDNNKKEYCIILYPCKELNDYIQGRITGIIYVITGKPEIPSAWMRHTNSGIEYMRFTCTDEQYRMITETICMEYGDLLKYEFRCLEE